MESRFTILTFPQRFDGAGLHLRILLVPRLSLDWNGDPLLPIDGGDALRRRRSPTGGARDRRAGALPLRLRGELHPGPAGGERHRGRCPRAVRGAGGAGAGPLRALRRCRRGWPGRRGRSHRASTCRAVIASRSCSPARARGAPSPTTAITARSRRRRSRIRCSYRRPNEVSWGQIYAYCLRHHQLARRLGLVREASFADRQGTFSKTAATSTWISARIALTRRRQRPIARSSSATRRVSRPSREARGRSSRRCSFRSCSTIPRSPAAPARQLRRGVPRSGRLRRRLRQDRARRAAGQPEPARRKTRTASRRSTTSASAWDGTTSRSSSGRTASSRRIRPSAGSPGKPQRLDADGGLRLSHRRAGARRPAVALAGARAAARRRWTLRCDSLGEPPGRAVGPASWQWKCTRSSRRRPGGRAVLAAGLPAQWNGKSLVLPDEDAGGVSTASAKGKAAEPRPDVRPVGLETSAAALRPHLRAAGAAHGCDRRRAGRGGGVERRSPRRRCTSSATSSPSPCAFRIFPSCRTRSSTPSSPRTCHGPPAAPRLSRRGVHRQVRRSRAAASRRPPGREREGESSASPTPTR